MSRNQLIAIAGTAMLLALVAFMAVRNRYTSDTRWEQQVANMAKNASSVTIRFNHGVTSPIPADSWEIIQAELQRLTYVDVLSDSHRPAKPWASAETSLPATQSVSPIVIDLDGKHVLIDWDQKTMNFNRTWGMSTAMIRAVADCIPEPSGESGG